MPKNLSLLRFASAACAIALASVPALSYADSFIQTNLVSDIQGLANNTDPNLKNPWGVSFTPTSPFWTSDQATGLATLYNATGAPQSLVVTIPGSPAPPTGPTGTVFNAATAGFNVNGTKATFIFDNLNGTISAWNGGTVATVEATTPGAIYTGLAQNAAGTLLYAANSNERQYRRIQFVMGAHHRVRWVYRPKRHSRFRPFQHPEHRVKPFCNLCPAWSRRCRYAGRLCR